MGKKESKNKVKLLDYWIPPMEAGNPIGCLSTTFTFNSEFFEEECLTRFLQIDSEPKEDGPIYLIEREEKLNQIECAAVWIDQSNAKQKRNLRWDLVPIRMRSGILHAKISVLYWSNYLRIIVGSANLTELAYRKNLETVATIDIAENNSYDNKTAAALLEFLTELINTEETVDKVIRKRSLDFIKMCSVFVKRFADVPQSLKRNEHLSFPILIKPNGKSFFEQVSSIWEDHTLGGPPDICHITSPFFDPPSDKNKPAEELWKVLRKRGMAIVSFHTTGDFDADGNPIRLNAPRSIDLATPAGRPDVQTYWYIISETDPGNEREIRSLHTKNYWFENNSCWILYIVGSSNFTSKGLGFVRNCNFEANLALLTNQTKFPLMSKAICDSTLEGVCIEDIESVKWQPEVAEDQILSTDTFVALPPFFLSATLIRNDDLKIEFRFSKVDAPDEFKISDTEGKVYYDIGKWHADDCPEVANVPVEELELMSYFEISWKGAKASAILPLNISKQNCLPPPEDLKNLPLDILAMLITSAKPMHEVLRTYSMKNSDTFNSQSPKVDSLRKFDSATFLLQRTRKFSFALNKIQERFETPIATEASLNWRIFGPVGLSAVADAIIRESRHDRNETIFFLSEFWKQLGNVNPANQTGCLPKRTILNAIKKYREELAVRIQHLWGEADNIPIVDYSRKILATTE